MKARLEQQIAAAVQALFGIAAEIELTRPEEQFGDYTTNVALQLSKQLGKNPREVGETLAEALRKDLTGQVSDVTVAGPGFINLKLNDSTLAELLDVQPQQTFAGQEVLVEFGDPNPFKAMHIGHLYGYIVGDAICSLLEAAGAAVRRLSYHGDVGLHVAKAIWGLQHTGTGSAGTDFGAFYAQGAKAYEEDAAAKQQIDAINHQVYAKNPAIKSLYEEGKARSFDNFDAILEELGIVNDKRYLESQSAPAGIETVKQHTGKVFVESEGAVVFEGEKVGLHTRVFITGKGLPTYETKDLGLTELKHRDFPQAARSIIITANEQAEYFKVMLAALKEIDPDLAGKTRHMTHGFVSLSSGKMSSRTGDVYSAVSLLSDVEQLAKKLYPNTTHDVQIGAVKYAFTKHRLGGDLVYDVAESVSLEGNSGPYLQYAHARARSILRKAETLRHSKLDLEPSKQSLATGHSLLDWVPASAGMTGELEPDERSLVRKISEYPEVVDKAVNELMPHHVCTYLYELAQTFNRFYEKNRVVGDEREALRLGLVQHYAETLKSGLTLLGIAAPDKM